MSPDNYDLHHEKSFWQRTGSPTQKSFFIPAFWSGPRREFFLLCRVVVLNGLSSLCCTAVAVFCRVWMLWLWTEPNPIILSPSYKAKKLAGDPGRIAESLGPRTEAKSGSRLQLKPIIYPCPVSPFLGLMDDPGV